MHQVLIPKEFTRLWSNKLFFLGKFTPVIIAKSMYDKLQYGNFSIEKRSGGKLISVNAFLSWGLQHDWKLFLHNRLREKWENFEWKFPHTRLSWGGKTKSSVKRPAVKISFAFCRFFLGCAGTSFCLRKVLPEHLTDTLTTTFHFKCQIYLKQFVVERSARKSLRAKSANEPEYSNNDTVPSCISKMNHTPLFCGSYKRKFVFSHLISLSKKNSFFRLLIVSCTWVASVIVCLFDLLPNHLAF